MFGKQEILYQWMLGKTLYDMSKSIRGGIPILFPQAGPVSDEEEIILGYSLPQHGVVRQRTWNIEKLDTSSALLSFKSDALNTEFPYSFKLLLNIQLWEKSCHISCQVRNIWESSFPIAPWFHPYFLCNNKSEFSFWNLTENIQKDYDIWSQDGTIQVHNTKELIFEDTGNTKISLRSSGILNDFWIWSMKDKDFICIEPVYGDEGLFTKEPYILEPNKEIDFWMKLSCT